MSEIYDPDHWKSKEGIRASIKNVYLIQSSEALLNLSRSAQDSATGFKNLGKEREARICQLRAEMFAARAKELAMPKCKVCGDRHELKGDVCGLCWLWRFKISVEHAENAP